MRDHSVCTKRTILSEVSQLYDPLGILGPVTILAKILMQELWKSGLDWDEPVTGTILSNWFEFKGQLRSVEMLKIPRRVVDDNPVEIQAHGFADASERAYGACIYIRTQGCQGVHTYLLCAKSRVAPVKRLTLPRLELCAAVLVAKLMHKVKTTLSIKINKTYLWSDSTVVLHWVKNTSTSWKTFVANRVSIIQGITTVEDWYHVRSNENPADLISRGVLPEALINSDMWFFGPSWLNLNQADWPIEKLSVLESPDLLEQKRVNISVTKNDSFELFSKFSSFNTLLHVFAYVLRFVHNAKNKTKRIIGALTPVEINRGLEKLVLIVQNESFGSDIENLRSKGKLSMRSSLLSLNPFLDHDELLRVGGRLSNSSFDYDKKHPLLLPHHHNFTSLLFQHEHKRLLHCGSQTLLLAVREKFWPIAGKSIAKKVTRNCIICFKSRPRTLNYKMGDLPATRITPNRPFTIVGTDFAGPFLLKDRLTRGAKMIKAYTCIFVCFVTKAVHLELVSDLTTEAFLAAFKRFTSRRGLCSEIHSDNGTNYVGASNELKKIYDFLRNNENNIRANFIKHGINWRFIPARSPHFGGLWESVVRSMKSHLTKVIGNTHLAFDEFNTILAQVEACLNSRPLSPLSNDPTDLNPLTPGHFLIGASLQAVPEGNLLDLKPNSLSRWERAQQLTQEFWRRWLRECISQMQIRTKWKTTTEDQPKPGDMVLVRQDNLAALQWPIGRITNVFPGTDGIVRVVELKTARGTIKRTTKQVCKLPSVD